MTTQQQIIAICILASIAVPLGTFTAIKLINKLSRPPVNTLVRSGDIELDYIEHTQEIHDFISPQYPRYAIISNHLPWYDRVPSYQSGTLPSYHSVDRGFINSCLENSINLDFFIWLILFFILVILIRKVLISNINKIIILLVLFF